MASDSTLATGLAVGLVVGVVLGGVGALFLTGGPPTPAGPDPSNPPASIATATGCVPDRNANTGWLYEAGSGTSESVTANVTVAHAPTETVNATFEPTGGGAYVFRVETVESRGASAGGPDCTTGSTAQLGASLPASYSSLRVVVDGERVATLRPDEETTAELHPFGFGNATG